jgi:hypothetical protein
MHGAWHPILFNEDGDGTIGYEFNVTRVCSTEEPIRIRFYIKIVRMLKKRGKGNGAEAKHVRKYFCT